MARSKAGRGATSKRRRNAKAKSQAAQKGWETRKRNAEEKRRSEAARRGWETRRKNRPHRIDALLNRPRRQGGAWVQRQVLSNGERRVSATFLFSKSSGILHNSGKRIGEIAERLLYILRAKFPATRAYTGTILYKRSIDGKRFEREVITKYFEYVTAPNMANFALYFGDQSKAFYDNITNPTGGIEHNYQVRMIGLTAHGILKGRQKDPYGAFQLGEEPTLPIQVHKQTYRERMLSRMNQIRDN